MSAYHVCAWATWASTGSRAIASPIESVSSDGAKSGLSRPASNPFPRRVAAQVIVVDADAARSPKQRTSTAMRLERALVSWSNDHARAAVDVRRVLAGENEGFHAIRIACQGRQAASAES